LTDEHLGHYEAALDAFGAGRWPRALEFLHRVPTDGTAEDYLAEFILRHRRVPPPNWQGVIPLHGKTWPHHRCQRDKRPDQKALFRPRAWYIPSSSPIYPADTIHNTAQETEPVESSGGKQKMPSRHHRWWLMGLVSLLPGCANPVSPPCFEPPALPTVARRSLALDLSALPNDAALYPDDASYQGLNEADCPCLAARASTLGNLLDQKAQTPSPRRFTCLLGADQAGEQSRAVLQHAAHEARTRAAGDAMEAFYRLVEAEGRLPLVLLGMKEVNESLKRAEELQAKGLPTPLEISAIRKQLIDLRSDEVNARIAILQLNARLKVLLGLSCGDYCLWPLADLKVVPEVPDIDEAVNYGLHHRPDIAILEALAESLDAGSLTLASQTLGGLNPLLGEPPSSACLASLLACLGGGKTKSAKQQVQTLLAERKRQAAEEIRQAVGLVAYRVQLVILAQKKVENEERRIRELEEKKAKGLDAEAELTTARLNLYKAQGERLREVANWKIARARLRQAQGQLLEECPSMGNAAPSAAPSESAACCRTPSRCAR
jgi:hypothetical protein